MKHVTDNGVLPIPVTNDVTTRNGTSAFIAELDGVDADYLEAFKRTVHDKNANKVISQKQFAKYLNTKLVEGDITIQPCLLNGKLAWNLYRANDAKSRAWRTASRIDVSSVPQDLLDLRDNYKVLLDRMGTIPLGCALEKAKGSRFEAKVTELIGVFHRALKVLETLGAEYSEEEAFGLIQSLAEGHAEKVRKIKAGMSVTKMFEYRIGHGKKLRYLNSQIIKALMPKLISFIKKHSKPVPGDPIASEDDVNAHRLTIDIANKFILQFSIGTGNQYLGAARVVWKMAKKNLEWLANDGKTAIIDENPWASIEYRSYEEYPTCILSPEQTMEVLIETWVNEPKAFIATLMQFTLGLRSTEACCGLNKQHRANDKLEPIYVKSFTFVGGLYGLGVVIVPCHKTKDREALYRPVHLTPFAYSFWKPIIDGMKAKGLDDTPIWDGSHADVTKRQNRVYHRLGLFEMIAKRCGVPLAEVGKSCQANKSLGRHTFLTAIYYHATHTLNKDMTYVRKQAGHAERSHVLEEAYLALSNEIESGKYINLQAWEGFAFDPVAAVTISNAQNKKNTRKGYQDWFATLTPEERDARTASRLEGRRRFDTDPEFAPERAERKKKIGANTKKHWNSLSADEQKRRTDLLQDGQLNWLKEKTPEERKKLRQTRIKNMHSKSHNLTKEELKARGKKVWKTRVARFNALPPEQQAEVKKQRREAIRKAQATRWGHETAPSSASVPTEHPPLPDVPTQ